MMKYYAEGELDHTEYEGVILDLINTGGFVCIDGMSREDFDLLNTIFSHELDSHVIKTMTWIPVRCEFQAIV